MYAIAMEYHMNEEKKSLIFVEDQWDWNNFAGKWYYWCTNFIFHRFQPLMSFVIIWIIAYKTLLLFYIPTFMTMLLHVAALASFVSWEKYRPSHCKCVQFAHFHSYEIVYIKISLGSSNDRITLVVSHLMLLNKLICGAICNQIAYSESCSGWTVRLHKCTYILNEINSSALERIDQIQNMHVSLALKLPFHETKDWSTWINK